MDNQSIANGQLPQFDPTATPMPPSPSDGDDQSQAPGSVVEPSSQPEPAGEQTLTQIEDTLTGSDQQPDLPPPPFEDANPSTSIQPSMPSVGSDTPVAPADMNPQTTHMQDLSLPTFADDNPSDDQPAQSDDEAVDQIMNNESDDTPQDTPQVVQDRPQATEDLAAFEPPHESKPEAESIDNEPETSTIGDELSISDDGDAAAPTEVKDPATARNVDSDLDSVKQRALQELAPIANQLDQPPQERFNTMLELIQATDNHDLVESALQAAQGIDDEREKATALLNLVNEVTYLEKLDS